MHKKLINEFLKEEKRILVNEIHKVYNLKYDKKIFNWEDILITKNDYLDLRRIANLKLNKEDITFEIGYRYFRGNKILLKKGVFVPQYDTEQIVDLVLNLEIKNGNLLEIGSGTGAISIALKKETNFNITSIDVNELATNLSIKNNKERNIDFKHQDFKTFTPKIKFDILISNPPYIKLRDNNVEDWVKENQPTNALYAGEDGLDFYNLIFSNVNKILKKNTYIILEIGYQQAKEVKALAKKISDDIKVIKDYSGFDRFMVIKYEK